jgi:hypothetical protein
MGLTALGIMGIKFYGDYKYYCGRVDRDEFYEPIVDGLHEYIIDLNKKLKEKDS